MNHVIRKGEESPSLAFLFCFVEKKEKFVCLSAYIVLLSNSKGFLSATLNFEGIHHLNAMLSFAGHYTRTKGLALSVPNM